MSDEHVSPATGCPNTPPCPHPKVVHDIDSAEDPKPMCRAKGCDCGFILRPLVPSDIVPSRSSISAAYQAARSRRAGARFRMIREGVLPPDRYELYKRSGGGAEFLRLLREHGMEP
jgi:hypothetical protein